MINALNTPWTLATDRDGTEDIATIRDATGETLVTSSPFWMPEGGEPTPPTLTAMRAMVAAPKLLEALQNLWAVCDANQYEVPMGYRNQVFAAIAEATGRAAA